MSLRDKILTLNMSGNNDGGFPILRKDENDDGFRMVGYIGANELEHALSKWIQQTWKTVLLNFPVRGIMADWEGGQEVQFHTTHSHNLASSSVSSLPDVHARSSSPADPFDFSIYMDQVCSVTINALYLIPFRRL